MVVAGPDEEQARAAASSLVRAARRGDLALQSHGCAEMDEEPSDPPSGDRLPAQLFFHGGVDERRLAELRPPSGDGPDLLLWILPRRAPSSLRSIYLFSMWSWSLCARHVRCLLPPGTRNVGRESNTVREDLARMETEHKVETIALKEPWESPATDLVFGQILQSVLSSIRGSARSAPIGFMVGLLLGAFGASAWAQGRTDVGTVEIVNLEPQEELGQRGTADGALLVGPYHLIDLEAGIGEWFVDGRDLRLRVDPHQIELRHGGVTLAWDEMRILVREAFVVRGPGFTIGLWRGKVSIAGSTLRIEPVTRPDLLSGREGLFLAAILLLLVCLLFLRASTMRRKLATPPSSSRTLGGGWKQSRSEE
jgi:hypothetical protein